MKLPMNLPEACNILPAQTVSAQTGATQTVSIQGRPARNRWLLSALLILTTGCAQPESGAQEPPAQPPQEGAGGNLLLALPDRLIFSAATKDEKGQNIDGASAPKTVTLTNSSGSPVKLDRVGFKDASPAFKLVSSPAFPLTLAAGESLNLAVQLSPGNSVGVLRATLRAEGDSPTEISLSGLRARGLEGDNEPPLAQIVDALGYGVNVGGSGLILGTGPGLIGDEVAAPLFQRASAAPVTLRPVARYSPDGPSAYGSFVLDGQAARLQPLGTMNSEGYQSLNPPLAPGSRSEFDPGDQPFGIYLAANSYAKQNTFSLDRLNTGSTRHATRIYPLKDRAGTVIPNSYLLGFEPSENGDYQDAVFVLQNVRPVTGEATPAVQWLPRAAAPTTLYEGQGAAVNGELYVFGGFDKNVNNNPIATRAAHAYNPATNLWRKLRDIPDLVTHAGVAVDGQNIYLAGGFLGNHPGPQTDHVWKYSVTDDKWTSMPPLPEGRGGGGLAQVGRELHYFAGVVRDADGGYERDHGDHWALNLDRVGEGWRSAAPMPNPRNHIAGVALNGLIYAVGGQHLGNEDSGNQVDVDVYDPSLNTWQPVSPLPLPLGHVTASTVVWNGRLVVVGGVSLGSREVANVSAYDPATGGWTALTPLPGPRQSPVAGVIGGQLVVTTGATANGPTASTWVSQP